MHATTWRATLISTTRSAPTIRRRMSTGIPAATTKDASRAGGRLAKCRRRRRSGYQPATPHARQAQAARVITRLSSSVMASARRRRGHLDLAAGITRAGRATWTPRNARDLARSQLPRQVDQEAGMVHSRTLVAETFLSAHMRTGRLRQCLMSIHEIASEETHSSSATTGHSARQQLPVLPAQETDSPKKDPLRRVFFIPISEEAYWLRQSRAAQTFDPVRHPGAWACRRRAHAATWWQSTSRL